MGPMRTASDTDGAPPRPILDARPNLRERLTAPWRALPDFLVIGAQKAGTTSLHALLAAHPQIALSRHKECNVLTKRGSTKLGYRAFFPLRSECRARGVRRIGEATPYYLFHPLAPERAAAWLPGMRAIAILREPVERAWSHYRHSVRLRVEPLGLAEALAAEAERTRGGDGDGFRRYSYFARGCYAPQLERWFHAIGRERVLVLGFRELVERPAESLPRIAAFLGVDDRFSRALPERNRGGDLGEIDPAIRSELAARYERPNAELRRLLGDLPDW